MFALKFIVFALFISTSSLHATDYTKLAEEIAKDAFEQVDENEGEALLHSSIHATDYTKLAEEIAKDAYEQADENRDEAHSYLESTAEEVPLEKTGKRCLASQMQLPTHPSKASSEQKEILIFVSFSMPDPVLKALSDQALKRDARLIIRGLKNNSFQETQQHLLHLGVNIDIDPTLFEKFGINRVPTFIKRNGDEFDQVTGNISLEAALELFGEGS